jgi:hypothetical protein
LDDSPKNKPVLPTKREKTLFHFFVRRLLAARIAKLLRLQAFRVLFLVLRRRVVTVFTVPALQCNDFPHV